MKNTSLIYFLCISLIVTGCAGTKITNLDKDLKEREGFVTYQSKPYLWITADSSGKTLVYKFIVLPDKSHPIWITPKRGFGSGSTSFKLSDGWQLNEFGSTSDSKIPETITAAASLLTGFSPYLKSGSTAIADYQPVAGLYEITFSPAGIINGFTKVANYPIP